MIPRTVAFSTLGCKLNQYETDSLATSFRNAGYRIVDFSDPADIYVINTCTVTNRADRKSRNLLNRAQRTAGITLPAGTHAPSPSGRSDQSIVVLTGCHVDSHRDSLETDGRTFVIPNDQKHSIPELVSAHFNGELFRPSGSVFDFAVPDRVFHTRSMVKIQDGCDNYCSFCIIPYVRGRAVSRPMTEIIESVKATLREGAKEVVLTGVNMSRYKDGHVGFHQLVEGILELNGDFRLRISSLEPDQLTDQFIELFRHPRMCPHLHLCLQSGSERVLLAMRRQYTYTGYRKVVGALRELDPWFNLTTDIIVGFPGETETEFRESLQAIRENGFGHVHTFPYSLRTGTRAERMPDHLPAVTKTRWSRLVREESAKATRRYRSSLIGRCQRVLVESVTPGPDGSRIAHGLGEHYVPVQVPVPASATATAGEWKNTFVDVVVTEIGTDPDPILTGTLI